MKKLLVLAAGAMTAAVVAAPAPASADPICAEAQASGLFAVVHVGPACVPTPVPTVTDSESVSVGVETVRVTVSVPAP